MKLCLASILAVVLLASSCAAAEQSVDTLSRVNCVRILINKKDPAGSGFFLDDRHVVTCFHVIAKNWALEVQPNTTVKLDWKLHTDLRVELETGEKIEATFLSVPTKQDPTPIIHDFAILKLKRPISKKNLGLSFYGNPILPEVGADVYFSGYPLGTPAMLTHKGRISGIDKTQTIICIQAPINKGNSGGALLTSEGELIGILSMREGGITKKLDQTVKYYQKKKSKMASMRIGGIDPVDISIETIKVLNAYISTGIGYARNATHLRAYLSRHPLTKKQGKKPTNKPDAGDGK